MSIHQQFVKYPTGKIEKGQWCDCCARFNTRNITCSGISVINHQILMILRRQNPQKGWWALPGGYLDWDETIEACIVREFTEETGYQAKPNRLLGIYSRPDRDPDGRQNVDCCFELKLSRQTHQPDHEVAQLKFFPLNQLPEKIAFDHRQMITDYLKANY